MSDGYSQVSLQAAVAGNGGDAPHHIEIIHLDKDNEGRVVDIQPAVVQTDHDARVDISPEPEIDDRRIYRVSRHLRRHGSNGQLYDPVVLSLGPYHHGKKDYLEMEEIKEKVLNSFLSESVEDRGSKDRDFFYEQIKHNIGAIRKNYEQVKFKDEALSEIILCDACFIITYMLKPWTIHELIADRFGTPTSSFMKRDLYVLENQIPFWVIKFLLDLRFGEHEADKIICHFLSSACQRFNNSSRLTALPWKDGSHRPIHLLEAYGATYFLTPMAAKPHFLTQFGTKCKEICKEIWEMICKKCEKFRKMITVKCEKFWKTSTGVNCNDSNNVSDIDSMELTTHDIFEWINLPCRSVKYLQAKGILFRPSSQSLRDIKFTAYYFYGILNLPILFIDETYTQVLLYNIVAFELSPNNNAGGEMLGYITFMKSLIDTPKDVNELRENGILYSNLGNDEEVVNVFKEIDTYGLKGNIIDEVQRKINEHCQSNAKTWMADLFHSYCHTPWAAIAVITGAFVLCLTFLQTYYTIHPLY